LGGTRFESHPPLKCPPAYGDLQVLAINPLTRQVSLHAVPERVEYVAQV